MKKILVSSKCTRSCHKKLVNGSTKIVTCFALTWVTSNANNYFNSVVTFFISQF